MAIDDIKQTLSDAQAAIDSAEYEEASRLSGQLSEQVDSHKFTPVLKSDGKPRDYSIVVVAHRSVEEHPALVEALASFDRSRFEVIFVENAADSIFDIGSKLRRKNIRVLRLGENLGIGVARNAAIDHASGDAVIFIDDDGLTDERSIESLIELYEEAEATCVRGRVVPRNNDQNPPQHYDPGRRVLQRYCDIEGLSIWRKSELYRAGKFDPILFGHEGVELTARLYSMNGPDAFLYQPKAVLLHEFSSDPSGAEAKMARYEKLTAYICNKNPDYRTILNVFRKAPNDFVAHTLLQHRMEFVKGARSSDKSVPVSFITTCFNGAEFLAEFVDGLKAQTDQNFELVFVDDGSEDGSADVMEALVPSDMNCKIIRSENCGRSAALNKAVAAASHDICLIADADDVPLPQRVSWTKHAFDLYPSSSMMGFMIFDVQSHARASRPFPSRAVPLSVRSIFGMPSPFPAFAFRKSKISVSFDENLTAGVDCDWLFRSMIADGSDGFLIPLNMTYYRMHAGQITASRRHLQRATSLRHLTHKHEQLVGAENFDEELLGLFAGWTPIKTGGEYWRMHEYALSVLQAASAHSNLDLAQLRREVFSHLDAQHIAIMRNDYKSLKSNHQSQSKNFVSLQNEFKKADRELSYARYSLDQLYASRSWRLTRPIRALSQWMSRS